MTKTETSHIQSTLATPGGSGPALTLYIYFFEMGCKCELTERPSAPDSRLKYEKFVKHWSVANINQQVVSKQSYQLFPKKISDHVQDSFSHLFLVFAIKIELFVKRKSCFESDLG